MYSNEFKATKGNILIVDDTPENLRVLSTTLSEQGYKVRGVVNGQMALRVVAIGSSRSDSSRHQNARYEWV